MENKQGYYYGSYAFQQFLWQDPDKPSRGWGLFGQFEASDGNPNPVGASVILGVVRLYVQRPPEGRIGGNR